MLELTLRRQLIQTALAMNGQGLNHGSSGNLSLRHGEHILITPSGLAYEDCRPQDIVRLDLDGRVTGGGRPSSEWPFHCEIYRSRPEAGAVLHAHSPWCTTLACLEREIPPFHYMIAAAGGSTIRCAEYALFGSRELSENVLRALADRCACLMAHHGMVCFSSTPQAALELAVEVENLARLYVQALQIEEPALLTEAQMAEVKKRFAAYRGSSGISSS
jgi:L-fuculose-phosphate aldolase